MWISREQWERQTKNTDDGWREAAIAKALQQRLEVEIAQLRNDADWFKMRINQLERERAALLKTTTGTRIEVPEFLPSYDAKDAVQPDQDMFRGVGDDDPDEKAPPVNYDTMPQRARN